ncbi:MAG: diphthamide biosynthesis enzyme Dph2 [Thermoplasmata archaeon]
MKLQTDTIIEKLRQIGAKKVMIQVPDGLKPGVFDLFNALSKEFGIIISSDPFFGACDVGDSVLYKDVDCILQLGHSEIPNINYPKPVVFVEYKEEKIPEIGESLFREIKDIGVRRIGLLFSIQYVEAADRVKSVLQKMGFDILIGKNDGRLKYPGQVLGCNYSTGHSIQKDVDCFLLVSTGIFHGLGAQLALPKDVYLLDLNDLTVRNLAPETDRVIRKRYASIERAMNSRKICIVVDTKIGQKREKLAKVLVEQAREADLEPVLIYSNNASPTDYENMRCDAVVFTGCPRVPIDDQDRYSIPVLTAPEFRAAIKARSDNRYVMDEIVSTD